MHAGGDKKMKTGATNKKIRELITMVSDGTLIPRPEFQRRLVWSRDDKNHFLDTILKGYPFPEIYFADGDVDIETGKGNQLLVDGQQRISTIIQYFHGDPNLKLTTVTSYKELHPDDKKEFLNYDVAVRDLGAIDRAEIIEVFRRINATKYGLTDIEINNAVYAGKFKIFAEEIADRGFFKDNPIFNAQDYKRMGDLRFVLSILATMMMGYFNRDDAFEDILDRYNDDFPTQKAIQDRLDKVLSFITECGFAKESRFWKKADLFTAIIELDQNLNIKEMAHQPIDIIDRVNTFYNEIDKTNPDSNNVTSVYYKAALQASNDKLNRVRRGIILDGVINNLAYDTIYEQLATNSLI